ncbi:hypothetical protein [Streptomyces sp. NPDC056227]|uniref:hypothetical protein n=1 Tax=Streptomyces sp. NPDC056227 TaxID=3345753 RepID=UPI0035D829D2
MAQTGAPRSRKSAGHVTRSGYEQTSDAGAHIRRNNPRDATIIGDARMHRLIRRGTTYGPPLPEGVLEDPRVCWRTTAPTGA